VRLITRNGYDWTKRYQWIIEAALKNRHWQFVLGREAVVPFHAHADVRPDFDWDKPVGY
jgi:ATP-dependent DNA ligase